MELRGRIETSWDGTPDRAAIDEVVARLDRGELRVADPPVDPQGEWLVHDWLMKAILLYFRVRGMETHKVGPYEFHDKIPLKRGLAAQGVRLVPPGHIRYGAFCERGVIVMPGYVNIGARVGFGGLAGRPDEVFLRLGCGSRGGARARPATRLLDQSQPESPHSSSSF
jgi:2,3,4,5-tetrahydropyridine-2-carboxylate N-succinyltransferase